ncbi:unnamed protein product, partial [Phaeothamnion confervicola]
ALQGRLNFEGCTNPQFASSTGLGRIAVAAWVLGIVLGVHLCILGGELALNGLSATPLLAWSLYAISLSFFHFSEFFTTAVTKPNAVTYDSPRLLPKSLPAAMPAFVLNHSTEYTVAVLASWAEFWLEAWLAPGLKQHGRFLLSGLAVVAVGQAVRVCAMWTAGRHFSHQIMTEREDGHALVTHGVYRWLRHPSYFGWFWWSTGSQLLLANPFCFIGYTLASWVFFRRRI